MKNSIIIFLLCAFYMNSSFAQNKLLTDEEIKTKIDDVVKQNFLNKKDAHAIIIGIYKYGSSMPSVYSYGKAGLDSDIPVNGSSILNIGSVTKTFKATLAVIFEKEGLLKLDDAVQKFMPDNVIIPSFEGQQIKLVQLATHTSSLPRVEGDFPDKDKSNPKSLENLYGFLNYYKLKYAPGTKWLYSNLGFLVLGQTLENISKKSFEDIVVAHICKPLGMKDTRLSLNEEQAKRRLPVFRKGETFYFSEDLSDNAGGASLYSTVDDMIKYLGFNLGIIKTDFSYATEVTQAIHWTDYQQIKFAMGLAWQIKSYEHPNITIIAKDGGLGGYITYVAFVKESKTGVVMLNNSHIGMSNMGIEILKFLNR